LGRGGCAGSCAGSLSAAPAPASCPTAARTLLRSLRRFARFRRIRHYAGFLGLRNLEQIRVGRMLRMRGIRPRSFLRRSMRAAAGLERARWASTLWSFCDALSARSSIYACRACNTGMALTAMWSQVLWRPVQPSRGALQEIACREPYRAKSTVRII